MPETMESQSDANNTGADATNSDTNPWDAAAPPIPLTDPDVAAMQDRLARTESELVRLEAEARIAPPDGFGAGDINSDPLADDPVVKASRATQAEVGTLRTTVETLKGSVEKLNHQIAEARKRGMKAEFRAAVLNRAAEVAKLDPILASNPKAIPVMLRKLSEIVDVNFNPDISLETQFAGAMTAASNWRREWAEIIDRREAATGRPPTKEEKRQLAEQLDASARASTTASGSTPPTVSDRTTRARTAGDIYRELMDAHARN